MNCTIHSTKLLINRKFTINSYIILMIRATVHFYEISGYRVLVVIV